MYFYNARWRFKIGATPTAIPGSVIAASALSLVDLERRHFTKYPHMKRLFLDPQLYMATIDPSLDSKTVARLSAYPWFHGGKVPQYDSGEHGSRTNWKNQHKE